MWIVWLRSRSYLLQVVDFCVAQDEIKRLLRAALRNWPGRDRVHADVLRVGSLWVCDVRGDRLERIRDPAERLDPSRKATQDNSTLEQHPSAPWVPFRASVAEAPGESGWIPVPA